MTDWDEIYDQAPTVRLCPNCAIQLDAHTREMRKDCMRKIRSRAER